MATIKFNRSNTKSFQLFFACGVNKQTGKNEWDFCSLFDTMAQAERAIKEIFENNNETMQYGEYSIWHHDILIQRYILVGNTIEVY